MQDMITFCIAILDAIVDFLATPPIFYLFCLVCFVPIIAILKSLLKTKF